tara:strand:- start:828 stop:1295 length:468 start_codon:yes stop_codon:yes gene_type:complete
MTYRITGLDPAPFHAFYGLSDAELAGHGVVRYRVDSCPGFPDRVAMQDIAVGDTALLLNYAHLPVSSPYRSCHAIFVQEGAETAFDQVGHVPPVMTRRLIALRGFDDLGFMLEAEIAEGDGIEPLIHRLFGNPAIAYIHAHNAKRGCFSGLISRA